MEIGNWKIKNKNKMRNILLIILIMMEHDLHLKYIHLN